MKKALSSLMEYRLFWRIGPMALLLALMALSVACSSQRSLYQPYDENGEPIVFKRRAVHETRDLFHHWKREVYTKVDKPSATSSILLTERAEVSEQSDAAATTETISVAASAAESCPQPVCAAMAKEPAFAENLSEDQQIVIAEFGAPDYIREPFLARTREETTEWLYLQSNLMVQFVDGLLVYSGTVTDKENLLLRNGYPLKNIRLSESDGPFRETLVYRNSNASTLWQYALANDELVWSVE